MITQYDEMTATDPRNWLHKRHHKGIKPVTLCDRQTHNALPQLTTTLHERIYIWPFDPTTLTLYDEFFQNSNMLSCLVKRLSMKGQIIPHEYFVLFMLIHMSTTAVTQFKHMTNWRTVTGITFHNFFY